MSNTRHLSLPFIAAAQAQKHVTVNEALSRIDCVVSGTVLSRSESVPTSPEDGDCSIVPDGAGGAWAGRDGEIACFLNGGWDFIQPWNGMQIWVSDEAMFAVFVGRWVAGATALSPGGAATFSLIAEFDHELAAGPVSSIAAAIPDKAVVLGVSARVLTEITGTTSWRLGVTGSDDRYGSGFGAAQGAFAEGVTGSPLAYYGPTDLIISAEGGAFSAGSIRVAIHYASIAAPAMVS